MKRGTETAVGFLVLFGLLLLLSLGWALLVHDDWRCAFAECRIETK